MNYEDARKYIDSIARFGSKLGLENIRNLMGYLGDPQKKLKFVHVAGTNGKGSTVAFLCSILKSAGFRTGMYTSPFVERFSERIRVNGEEIGEEDFARLATQVKEAAGRMKEEGKGEPTEFEIITAIAFLYFYEKRCDICVLEVGLGGRLDATNVINDPLVCMITPISCDHTDILGNTPEKIAYEKAGIIKEGSTVLIHPQETGVMAVIERVCLEKKAKPVICSLPEGPTKAGIDGVDFYYEGNEYHTGLLGDYQINNAAMSVSAARILQKKGFDIKEEDIKNGLSSAEWKGRFELIRKEPYVLIDGSHNVSGMERLASSLGLYFKDTRIILIIGILKDKDYGKMLDIILPLAKTVYTVTVPSDRTLTADELLAEVLKRTDVCAQAVPDPVSAYEMAVKKAGSTDIICACGSLYYIGLIRKAVLHDDDEFRHAASDVNGHVEDF
ncbi:MAG: bifunctional folylpolyglutamate synthase/dihydrofolate synthase [Lachnospiraceae bacterium]|nr:bifunctional folylpolyglutamate synthase/dihydrofolate synthase [Lachnospiraceae bacterium]